MPLGVRPAIPGDAPSLAALRYQFRSALTRAVEPEPEFLERSADWMRRRLTEPTAWRCWLLEHDGAIRGHLRLQLIEKIPNPVAEPEHHASRALYARYGFLDAAEMMVLGPVAGPALETQFLPSRS